MAGILSDLLEEARRCVLADLLEERRLFFLL